MSYLWDWFNKLNGKREMGFGLNPITHQAIAAWATLYRVDIGPWEVSILDQIDAHFRSIHQEKSEGNDKGQSIQDAAQDAVDLRAAQAAHAARRKARLEAQKGG